MYSVSLPIVDGQTIPPKVTPTPTPVQIGLTYRLKYDDALFPDEFGAMAYDRATGNADDKSMDQILKVFEHMWIEPNTLVKVRQIGRGTLKQLDVMSGKHTGRRGWTATYTDSAYMKD